LLQDVARLALFDAAIIAALRADCENIGLVASAQRPSFWISVQVVSASSTDYGKFTATSQPA